MVGQASDAQALCRACGVTSSTGALACTLLLPGSLHIGQVKMCAQSLGSDTCTGTGA